MSDSIKALRQAARVDEVDPEAVLRFIHAGINQRAIDPADATQAAVVLGALVTATRSGDDVGAVFRQLLDIRKPRAKRFNSDHVTTSTPAWNIVEQLVRGEIRHVDAARLFATDIVPGASIRQCERLIHEIRPRVETTLNTLGENTDV